MNNSISFAGNFRKAVSIMTMAAIAPVFWPSTAAADHPDWERILEQRLAEPQEWRNALKPEGEEVEFKLGEGGRPEVAVMVPQSPTSMELKAADELATWLGEMSGMSFSIVPEGTEADGVERVISVGRTERFAESDMKKRILRNLTESNSEAENLGLAKDGYAIAYEDGDLFLLGGSRVGPIYAVLALLEEDLGFRWYTPAATRVPPMPENGVLTVVPRSGNPAIQWREPNYWPRSHETWRLRNRVNGGRSPIRSEWGGYMRWVPRWVHSSLSYVHVDNAEEHPEWFAYHYQDDQPATKYKGNALCVSNKKMRAHFKERVREHLHDHPQAQFVDISPMDNGTVCKCEQCQKLRNQMGGEGGTWLDLTNEIAAALEDEFPDITFTLLAYWSTKKAPPDDIEIQARENVAVRYCSDWTAIRHPYYSMRANKKGGNEDAVNKDRDNFERWHEIVNGRMMIWHYPHYYSQYLAPLPNLDVFADNVRFWAERDVLSIYNEGAMGPVERDTERAWIYGKLMWNPDLDLTSLIEDFVRGYYKDAAPAILAYYDLLNQYFAEYGDRDMKRFWKRTVHREEFLRHGFTEQANMLFEKAMTMTDDEDVLQRIKVAWLPVVYVELALLEYRIEEKEELPDEEHLQRVISRWHGLTESLVKGETYGGNRKIGHGSVDSLPQGVREKYQTVLNDQEVKDEDRGVGDDIPLAE